MDSQNLNDPRVGTVPCFTNGKTSTNGYLVVASNPKGDRLNAVGLRYCPTYPKDEFKVHFWPDASMFLPPEVLKDLDLYATQGGRSSLGDYEGLRYLSASQVQELLKALKANPDLVVAPMDKVIGVAQRGYSSSQHVSM